MHLRSFKADLVAFDHSRCFLPVARGFSRTICLSQLRDDQVGTSLLEGLRQLLRAAERSARFG